METHYTISDLILVDELVNDFEFAERLYETDFSKNNHTSNIVWADML